jgi:hypothetical protein
MFADHNADYVDVGICTCLATLASAFGLPEGRVDRRYMSLHHDYRDLQARGCAIAAEGGVLASETAGAMDSTSPSLLQLSLSCVPTRARLIPPRL